MSSTPALLLYIHGFLSSPQSFKASSLERWLSQQSLDLEYCCPLLTPYPDECAARLVEIVESRPKHSPIYLVGSSMGGFWATWLAERYCLPAVLVNPAVEVLSLMPKYLNQPLNNYYTDHIYYLESYHLDQLATYDVPVTRHDDYWLLLQTGDETLDYRLAVEKYSQSSQTVEPGGDHSFQGFGRYYEQIMAFFQAHTRANGR